MLNIGGGSQISLNDAVELIGDLSGRELEVTYEAPRKGEVANTCADTGRARRTLSFTPEATLEHGLAAELDWIDTALTTNLPTPSPEPRGS